MNPLHIKSAIIKAGTSQTAIAEYLGVSPTSVGRVIAGSLRSLKIETELAKIVGQPLRSEPHRKPGRPKTVWNGQLAKKVQS